MGISCIKVRNSTRKNCGIIAGVLGIITLILYAFDSNSRVYDLLYDRSADRDSLAETTKTRKRKLIYEERRQRMQHECKNIPQNVSETRDTDGMTFIYDESNRLLYCSIPKVASNFLEKTFRKMKITRFKSLVTIKKNTVLKERVLKDALFSDNYFFKFMFVREPYGRMVSGYVDKFMSTNAIFWGYGKFIIDQIRPNATANRTCGHDLTFPEFVRFVIRQENENRFLDTHFYPMHRHCFICRVAMDFIGKVETVKDDTLYLIELWNKKFNMNISYTDFESQSDIYTIANRIQVIFDLKDKILKCISFYDAMKRAWRELQIRGLVPIEADLPFKQNEIDNITFSEFVNAAHKVIENITDHESVRRQRKEALIEAYSLLSPEEKGQLQKILEADCKLFGYDPKPSEIFSLEQNSMKLKYFSP